MNILVTGGCGFIGSNFIRIALGARKSLRVTNLDALTYAGNPENLKDLEKIMMMIKVIDNNNNKKQDLQNDAPLILPFP